MRKPELWRAHDEVCDRYGKQRTNILASHHCSRSMEGELVYLPVMGRQMMILGSPRVVSELLDKRSAFTSNKPPSALITL
ncbi:hypothetical protein OH76DRAFT_1349285 [Lentinus brumalis]|uniref:Cytochrome P450 n=1 Tax=Lentinus brumalis TaxID=2498619 RepID=A0A371DCV9_9APHY|nr:hypothetical protein OH76DRAFT_1349285 [Polyporus brumalis]